MRILFMTSLTCGMAGETGGVLRLFRTYIEMARFLGYEVGLYSLWDQPDFSTVDLIHIAPCDLSMLGVARRLREMRIPCVVSPILDKLYSDSALRMVTWGDRLLGRLYRSHLGAAKEICSLASGVCLMSSYEDERLRNGLGVKARNVQVVKPVSQSEPVVVDKALFRNLYTGDEFVLFVGDLSNSRKNVLRLIEACANRGLPLVLIGPLVETPYGQCVKQAIQKTPNVSYLGVVPRAVLFSAMGCCRVFALPSLMEGIGLAAVEAGVVGARVVITRNGGPSDYFGNMAWYVDPYSVRSIADGLVAAWNANETSQLMQFLRETLSITTLAPKLDALYCNALSK